MRITVEIPDAEVIMPNHLGGDGLVVVVTGEANTEYVFREEWIIRQEEEDENS